MLSSQTSLFHPLDLHKFSYNFATMPGLMQAMEVLRATFDKYAGKEGDKDTLTKGELADLLKSEVLGGEAASKAAADEFFTVLDEDKNGVVDFTEYITLVASLMLLCKK